MTMPEVINEMLVTWARHGENAANLTRQFSHRRLDLDLTVVGRQQAEALATSLAGRFGVGTEAPPLFASPLRRAQQTAEVVARRLQGNIETIEGLRELNVGDLDGRSDSAAWATYESVLAAWRRGEHDNRFPHGEDWHELCARLGAALKYIARHVTAGPAVVVAHGANLRAALPGVARVDDPGTDLGTGQVADLEVLIDTDDVSRIRLLVWGSTPR